MKKSDMKKIVFILLLVVFGFAAECGAQQAAKPAPLNLEVTLRIEGGRVVSVQTSSPKDDKFNVVVFSSAFLGGAVIFLVAVAIWARKEERRET